MEATVSPPTFKDVASFIKTSFHWVAHMVWATLGFFRPLEIPLMSGIELFLMNDHSVVVLPVKSCREHGPMARGLGGKMTFHRTNRYAGYGPTSSDWIGIFLLKCTGQC
jgi:hypothetical protein